MLFDTLTEPQLGFTVYSEITVGEELMVTLGAAGKNIPLLEHYNGLKCGVVAQMKDIMSCDCYFKDILKTEWHVALAGIAADDSEFR